MKGIQVAVLETHSPGELQRQINDWLSAYPDVDVEDIKVTGGLNQGLIATIIHRGTLEKEEPAQPAPKDKFERDKDKLIKQRRRNHV